MDCKTARQWLEFHRPRGGELTAEDVAALEGHLAVCADCDAAVRAERAADAALARAMQAVPIPAGLQDRLLARLDAEGQETERQEAERQEAERQEAERQEAQGREEAARPEAERLPRPVAGPTIFRRLRQSSPRVRAAALAAAVLLAAGLTTLVYFRSRPPALDVAALRDREFAQYGSPRPDWIQEWFQTQHGVAMTAPQSFDYAYLVYYGLGSCQGRRVPELVFVRDATRAHVYVVSQSQFDLAQLPAEPGDLNSVGFRVDVWRSPDAEDSAFIIFSNGDSLEPLLTRDRPPPV